jgi:hypothetical protein
MPRLVAREKQTRKKSHSHNHRIIRKQELEKIAWLLKIPISQVKIEP